jgi:hypothetical protein
MIQFIQHRGEPFSGAVIKHAITIAADHNYVPIVRYLLHYLGDELLDPDTTHHAVVNSIVSGDNELVEVLLPLDVQCCKERLIKVAAIAGNASVLRLFMTDRSLSANDWEMALLCASKAGHLPVVKFLIEWRSFSDTYLRRALQLARETHREDIALYLSAILEAKSCTCFCQ